AGRALRLADAGPERGAPVVAELRALPARVADAGRALAGGAGRERLAAPRRAGLTILAVRAALAGHAPGTEQRTARDRDQPLHGHSLDRALIPELRLARLSVLVRREGVAALVGPDCERDLRALVAHRDALLAQGRGALVPHLDVVLARRHALDAE